jgi:5-methylcytosine-specific restriction endonuclease McrA
METPAWSRDRLRDRSLLDLLVRVFQQSEQGSTVSRSALATEAERLKIVPLVFGLLPEAALVREKPDQRIKPAIVQHLANVGVPPDDVLVSTLKRVADQYFASAPRSPLSRRQKVSIESVRALRLGIYSRMQTRQGGRCAICGILFGSGVLETLDHVLPWRLAGDPFDGANWQLLCRECNTGKRERLSAMQSPQALNWLYGLIEEIPVRTTLETRYLAFAMSGKCQLGSCGAEPRSAQLHLARRHATGLPVIDNLVVRCETHLDQMVEELPEVPPAVPTPTPAAPETLSVAEGPAPLDHFGGYVLSRRVSSGGMAECFVGIAEESGEPVFLKRVREGGPDFPALQREAEIYQKLERSGAEHTVNVIDLSRCDGFLVLVMECAEYDLHGYVEERGPVATDDAKEIVGDIIEGLKELHSVQIVHRDLKPGNILRCGGRWVLADFGISKDRRVLGGGRTFRQMGTTGYAAPEQLLTGHEADPAADVYALGKVMVFLLTGGTDVDRVTFRQWRKVIRDCTAEDSAARPSLTDIAVSVDNLDE